MSRCSNEYTKCAGACIGKVNSVHSSDADKFEGTKGVCVASVCEMQSLPSLQYTLTASRLLHPNITAVGYDRGAHIAFKLSCVVNLSVHKLLQI